MKTKILAGVALVALATAGTITYAANTGSSSTLLNNITRGMHLTGSGGWYAEGRGKMGGRSMEGFGMMGWSASILTDAEKTKLATMTNTEKQAFFEAKITADKALRDAKETVIDKLINGEALSNTEKATLETIKTERTKAKTERIAREKEMTELKPILEKVKAGATLSTDEQAKLDAWKTKMPQGNGKGHGKRGGMMRGIER